jgi:hypothetical protein
MKFLDCFKKEYHTMHDVSSLHESSLCKMDHMVCHRVQSNRGHLNENLETIA